jgi:hypothetical protein
LIANEWGGAFFLPLAFRYLCGDTQTRMRLHREARPQGQPQVTGTQGLNRYTHIHRMTKIPPLDPDRIRNTLPDSGALKLYLNLKKVKWNIFKTSSYHYIPSLFYLF